jgi:hypothetical protein
MPRPTDTSLFLKPARRAQHDPHHIMRQEQEDATPLKPNPCYLRRGDGQSVRSHTFHVRLVSANPLLQASRLIPRARASLPGNGKAATPTIGGWGTYVAGTSAHPKNAVL